MKPIDTTVREVLITLKEEQACLQLWFKDKSVNEDVRRGIEKSLTKISRSQFESFGRCSRSSVPRSYPVDFGRKEDARVRAAVHWRSFDLAETVPNYP